MKQSQGLLLVLPLLWSITPSVCAIDLKPRFETRVFEGEQVRKPYFLDGDKRYGVITDSETEIGETATGAIFRFRTIPLASVTLSPSPFPTTQVFGPATEPAYRQAAQRMLPAHAEELQLEEVIPDPIQVNGWHSYRFTFSYKSPAGNMREAITFLNLTPEQQIVIRAVARQTEWKEVASRADDIISRWYEIRSDEATYN